MELHNFSFLKGVDIFRAKQFTNGGSSSVHPLSLFGCGDEFSQGQITNIPWGGGGGGAPRAIYARVCFGGEALTWVLRFGVVVETWD